MSYNPYNAPRINDVLMRHDAGISPWSCWLRTWLGIVISGVLFGVIGGPIGMIIGGIIAFSVSLVVTAFVFPLAHAVSDSQLSLGRTVVVGGCCGLASGVVSVALPTGGFSGLAIAAGIVGMIGGISGHGWANVASARRRHREIARSFDERPVFSIDSETLAKD